MKVLPFKIPKTSGESIRIQVDKGRYFYDKLHQHEEIQISFVVSGKGRLFAGDSFTQYVPGDMFVIGQNTPHLFDSEKDETEDSHMISIFFTWDSFYSGRGGIAELEELKSLWEKALLGLKTRLTEEDVHKLAILELPDLSGLKRVHAFFSILKYLQNTEKSAICHKPGRYKYSESGGKRMANVFDYTLRRFHHNISLDEISSIANMNKYAFCRYFKKSTNKSYFSFLLELRIEEAAIALRKYPDKTIAEIAEDCGFQNMAHFNRQFKLHKKVRPSEYRKLKTERTQQVEFPVNPLIGIPDLNN